MGNEHTRQRLAGWYLIGQGLATLAWWTAMAAWSTFQDWFVAMGGWPAARTVLVADVVVFGGGSVCVGLLSLDRHPLAGPSGLVLIGATIYATFVSAAWVTQPVDRWPGLIIMLGASAATVLAVAQINAGSRAD